MIHYIKIKNNYVHKSSIVNWGKIDIGRGNVIGPNVIIGTDAQHPYKKSKGKIIIGNNNIFREFSTIHLPTDLKKVTKIGNNCYFMTLSHIAHDCIIEDEVIFANNVTLGGIAPSINSNDQRNMKRHPTLEDNVVVGSGAQILGPIVIGKNSLIGSNSVVTKNVSEKSVMAGIPARRVGDATKGFKPYAVTDEDKE